MENILEESALMMARASITEYPDDEVRRALEFASKFSWFQQPGRTLFADRLYQEAAKFGVDADLADALMRFFERYGVVLLISKFKWVIRKSFTSDLVDAGCVVVAKEKLAA
jgi:hypothetical protein